MYEDYTRQSLPSRKYRELLGSALCVYNSNNAFIIENILHTNDTDYNWYDLIDKESGRLLKDVSKTITKEAGEEIERLFSKLVEMRNRIIHSFQVTHNGEQILATKTQKKDGNKQFIITEEYLLEFIKLNEELCLNLHTYRDKIKIII